MKFSVIVPVYNVEGYLDECLQSIVEQDYHDYEVLLINDGSTDSSGEICTQYARKFSQFKVFHQQNKGVSAARNWGIEKAAGEWICFIDSDDYIESNYLKIFADNISPNSDMIIQGIKRIGKITDTFCSFSSFEKISKYAFFHRYHIWPHYFSPFCKIFRKSILIERKIRYVESICYGEDTLFNLDYALQVSGLFTLLPNIHYVYRFNFEGLATKEVGYYKRKDLLKEVHCRLAKLTDDRDDLYPYCVTLLDILYRDKNVHHKYAQLKWLLRDYGTEILKIYKGDNKSLKIITYLIKNNCYFFLNTIFKIAYRKRV